VLLYDALGLTIGSTAMTHTVKVISGGIVLAIFCFLIGHLLHSKVSNVATLFFTLWFVIVVINLVVGVVKAGYSLTEEIPIALVCMGIPSILAGVLWWRLNRF
jgi:hypothetical protein